MSLKRPFGYTVHGDPEEDTQDHRESCCLYVTLYPQIKSKTVKNL